VVDTWREDYQYTEKMPREEYEYLKRPLQVELVKLQNWVKSAGERVVLVFEGRDAAGKGGGIKRFTEHLNPRGGPGGGAGQAEQTGTDPVVFPASRAASARGGRDRHVRPVLV
jgi:hypothetical protein